MAISRARKEKLTQQYMIERKYPKITPFQTQWAKSHTAEWIVVTKENGVEVAHCTSCDSDIEIGKTKHKGKVICPHCKKEMEVLHAWRVSKYFSNVKFVIIPRAIDEDTLMLRYYSVWRSHFKRINDPIIEECARHIINLKRGAAHTFENAYGHGWKYTTQNYFRERNMYNYRDWCCLGGIDYTPLFTRELRKLNRLKYMTPKMIKDLWGNGRNYYTHNFVWKLALRAPLYEKMYKVGLGKLAKEDFHGYNPIGFAKENSTLTGMLGISREQLKTLRRHPSLRALQIMMVDRTFNPNEEMVSLISNLKISTHDWEEIRDNKPLKTLRYLSKQKIALHEWKHYLRTLENIGYQLDDAYMFPKDFRREDARVTEEYRAKREERRKENENKRDGLMYKIAEGLRNNKELREFFKGSNGLQVFVPESAEELRREGASLHNCLRTYVERYSEGKTLIFFIRRMEDPTAPYIAMEYCHGRVIQCRLDYNEPVKDTKIIDFAEALARKLAAMDILAA